MSVLVGFDTRLVVQGVGAAGAFHARQMIEYGTNVVAGVKPGKAGSKVAGVEQLPIYDTVEETVKRHGANTSVIYVPPPGAADAILEAAAAGITTIIAITEGIPARDMIKVKYVLDRQYPDVVLVGPNCPGVITPGQCKVGIMPGYIHKPRGVGATAMPAALSAAILSAAAPLPPEMIAPAWPIRLPGGAVWPPMNAATGFFTHSLMNSAARSSESPPISPIMKIASVPGSSANSSRQSM